jgi:chromosome segregation ATPase
MPKKDYTQELKAEFAQGNLKPSQLKKSRSTENISLKPDTPTLTKSKSAEEISPIKPSLAEQIKQLKQDLTFSQNTAQNYLERLQQLTAEFDQKEQELQETKQTNTQLIDKNNELRLQSLKDFSQNRENEQGIEQAVSKLVKTEQSHINYQVQNSQLLREKTDLEKQLKSAHERIQKLYQLKGLPNTAKQGIN